MILVVMDYSVGKLFVKEVPTEFQSLEGDVIIRKMGFHESEISYMFTRKPVGINIESKENVNFE